jgi:hypothetical protein
MKACAAAADAGVRHNWPSMYCEAHMKGGVMKHWKRIIGFIAMAALGASELWSRDWWMAGMFLSAAVWTALDKDNATAPIKIVRNILFALAITLGVISIIAKALHRSSPV